MMRGIRGATTVATDTPEAIAEATLEMLESIIRLNDVRTGDIAAATFSTTADLCSAFPATREWFFAAFAEPSQRKTLRAWVWPRSRRSCAGGNCARDS